MSELGEGASISTSKVDPDKYLKARVTNVRFEGIYRACREKKEINSKDWHWPAGKPDGYQKSKKAVVYQVKKGKTHTATVKVKIDSKGISGEGTLTGTLGKLVFEGKIPLDNKTHEVTVTLKEVPEHLNWTKGSMTWEINAGADAALAGATRVELFFVFDDPASKKFFEPDGVWIEALRFIFKEARLEGTKEIKEGLGKVTQGCFKYPHHVYDIHEGANHFGGKTKIFSLANYMKPVRGIVNCYDQAYAVIVFSGALGTTVNGLFQLHFGYLKMTQLVGRGACNNPFPEDKFESVKKDSRSSDMIKLPTLEDYLVVDPSDIYRAAFINHMFCQFAGESVYDACAGPATGELNHEGYLKKNVDLVTPEPDYGHKYPKTEKDIEFNYTKKLFDIDMPGFDVGVHSVE